MLIRIFKSNMIFHALQMQTAQENQDGEGKERGGAIKEVHLWDIKNNDLIRSVGPHSGE